MKLNENQTHQFVSLYREHVCLWDITSEFYKHKGMRQSALHNICEGMQIEGFTVEDVKNKIKSMRSTYYLELDKIKKSSRSGDVYQPKLKWFAEFNSFIRHAMVKRKIEENTESQSRERADDDSSASAAEPIPETSTSEPRKKKSRIAELSSIVKNMKDINKDFSKSEREEDEFDIFGKYIATQLRKLSTKQAILGQEEIQKVVTKCRLNDLRHLNTSLVGCQVNIPKKYHELKLY